MSRSTALLMLWLPFASSGAQAQTAGDAASRAPGIVLWLDAGADDAATIERALRLELGSHGMLLLTSRESFAAAGQADEDGAGARAALERTTADAVLWLRAEPQRQVTWLRVLRRGELQPQQAPLAHASAPVDAHLLAVAAASLLDQVLTAPAPAVETQVTPLAAAQPGQAAQPSTAAVAPVVEIDPTPPYLRPAARANHARATTGGDPFPARRWFVQLGASLVTGSALSGMEADRPPPEGHVFTEDGFFRDDTGWVPDDDSEDELGAAAGNCAADGTVTSAGETPSKWCARMYEPGLVVMPALRLAVGYWVLPQVAIAGLYQWYPGIQTNTLEESHLLGVQGELRLAQAGARTLELSLLAGATVGRTDTPVPMPEPPADLVRGPDAQSGPFGLHGGARLRVRVADWGALFTSPTLGGRFPAWQFTAEAEIGMELWL